MKKILRLTFTLLLITAVMAAALAGVNAITKDRIAAAKAEKTARAISAVLENGASAEAISFSVEENPLVSKVYKNENGYAIQVSPSGFAGPVDMMVGVDNEGKITGISVISHTETAGLGAIAAANNAKGEAFRGQFEGLSGELSVGNEIDAISGATITSKAVTAGVNAALACVAGLG
jgi:electron transport complex protein RnfG